MLVNVYDIFIGLPAFIVPHVTKETLTTYLSLPAEKPPRHHLTQGESPILPLPAGPSSSASAPATLASLRTLVHGVLFACTICV